MSGNYGWGLPVAASSFAKEIDFGLYVIHGAMFLIFILWTVFFAYLLLRYRRREGVKAQYEQGSHWVSLAPDFVVLAFEIILIVVYAIPNWHRIKNSFPSEKEANVVEVTAEQFTWTFRHPGKDAVFGRRTPDALDFANTLGLDPADPAGADDIVTVNILHLPMGRKTLARLTSKDVIHSFFIPEFRVKQDIVPGMVIPVWFEPTLEGRFEITCAQLCGVGHASMKADVVVHTAAEYEKWSAQQAPHGAAAADNIGKKAG